MRKNDIHIPCDVCAHLDLEPWTVVDITKKARLRVLLDATDCLLTYMMDPNALHCAIASKESRAVILQEFKEKLLKELD